MDPFTPSEFGEAARAREPQYEAGARRIPMGLPTLYRPPRRDRPGETSGRAGDKYERYQSLSALAGTVATFAEVARFSGTPDAIDLLAVGGDAIVQLRDQLGQGGSSFRIVAGQMYQSLVSMRVVVAFNFSDAAPATVFAVGKWANPREAVNGAAQYEDTPASLAPTGTLGDPDALTPQPY